MKNVNERAVWSFNCMCYTGEKYCTWKSKMWFLTEVNFWIVFLYICFSLRLHVSLRVSFKSCSYSWKPCIYQTTQALTCFTVLWLVWLQQTLFFFYFLTFFPVFMMLVTGVFSKGKHFAKCVCVHACRCSSVLNADCPTDMIPSLC